MMKINWTSFALFLTSFTVVSAFAETAALHCEQVFSSMDKRILIQEDPTTVVAAASIYQRTAPLSEMQTTTSRKLFQQRIFQEFSLLSHQKPLLEAVTSLIYGQKITDRQILEIRHFLNLGHLHHEDVEKTSEAALDRQLNEYERNAIRLARTFDRDIFLLEQDQRPSEFFYTEAKERLMLIAGFKPNEVRVLTKEKVLSDDRMSDARYTFSNQAFDIPVKNIERANQELIQITEQWKNPDTKSGRRLGLSQEDAHKILTIMKDSEVAGPRGWDKYDPNGNIGFCFGRACGIHLLALDHEVHKDSIRKVFVYGPMQQWIFHVATVVAREDGGFWVLDPNYWAPLKLEEWFNHQHRDSTDQRLRLFMTSASRFGSEGFNFYENHSGGLKSPFYNQYFIDLIKELKKKYFVK